MRASINALMLVTAGCLAATPVRAAENATGIYLLGIKTSLAGFVPPPGTYVTDYNYYYSGTASGAAAAGGRAETRWEHHGSGRTSRSTAMPSSICRRSCGWCRKRYWGEILGSG